VQRQTEEIRLLQTGLAALSCTDKRLTYKQLTGKNIVTKEEMEDMPF
jgi:hypothetical protein